MLQVTASTKMRTFMICSVPRCIFNTGNDNRSHQIGKQIEFNTKSINRKASKYSYYVTQPMCTPENIPEIGRNLLIDEKKKLHCTLL